MKTKKIKIMLAGFVNHPNAQNINCDNIARRLDKNKFEVHALYCSDSPIDKSVYKKLGVKLHYVNLHRVLYDITFPLAMRGNYDIYYMPKTDIRFYNFAKKYKGKKLMVSSVESVITETAELNEYYQEYLTQLMNDIFSISSCIKESVKNRYGVNTSVLPLGVSKLENVNVKERKNVQNVIWVGNLKANKRPLYLAECAKAFPKLNFTMIGDGDMQADVEKFILDNNLGNLTLTGRIANSKVYEYMQDADLLLMTSENEGLPKVIQEAAQCGVPSIYIANCYTVDFIENGKNGYAVYSLEEMIEKINYLIENEQEYQQVSKKAKESVQNFTWDNLMPRFEQWFIERFEQYVQIGKNS